jgi:ATP-binding cassette subfamily F protein 3
MIVCILLIVNLSISGDFMIIISATKITKAYGPDTIFSDVSFHINQGDRVGIIGRNGAGKTTLLSILSGLLPFEAGDFYIATDTTVGYLKQKENFNSEKTVYEEIMSIFSEVITIEKSLEELTNKIAENSSKGEDVTDLLHKYDELSEVFKKKNGYSYKSEINGILSSMAFSEDYYDKKISLLSGGERTRLALASLLLKKPDLLLLDEPTNHLDIGTLKWLEQYLKNYTGTIILISHDRYFLDQTVNRIFELENHKLSIYEGNYSTYVEKKYQQEKEVLNKFNRQQREIQRQEEMIRRYKQHGTEKLAKRAKSREKRLEQIERLDRPEFDRDQLKIQFKEKFKSGTDVISAENLSFRFNSSEEKRVLFENVSFDIKRSERICLVGPNGIGKTTLLKIIMGELIPNTGIVRLGHNVVFGYYDQEQKLLNGNNTVLEELHDTYRLYTETELRNLLGRFLFEKDDVFKKIDALSGGEKARLSLLKLMLTGANLLIMDEPTNHLDLAAKEVFENALLDFPGTLFLVSHDRYLLNKVPTSILELSENGIQSFLGGYDYYVEKKQSISSGKNYLEELGKKTGVAYEKNGDNYEKTLLLKQKRMEERQRNKKLEAEKRKQERELASLEISISNLEEEIKSLETKMCLEEVLSDYNTLITYSDKLEVAKDELEQLYNLWIELH